MAVYEQTYRRYQGALTPTWSRFLILPRYSFQEVFKSRIFLAFFLVCFLAPLVGLILIYLRHNLSALALFNVSGEEFREALPISYRFFHIGLGIQGFLCFVVAFFVAPALVAPDLRNNGLPLYLSRPFSRAEYVLGKLTVLVALLSVITWIPGLLLFLFQTYLEGTTWLGQNGGIAWALFAASWSWILVLSLVSLAISAWVKWKPLARVALLGVFFILSGFAKALNEARDIWWGNLVSVWSMINVTWAALFRQPIDDGTPVGIAWVMLGVFCLVCLWLLSIRVRAYEVIR
ncbi:MAG TPA: ABC-2 transporter permease [Thermoanaerobaculia bacterium]|nr:ABC-2 transporter permease [Thermoanaerobaculia bacterium]